MLLQVAIRSLEGPDIEISKGNFVYNQNLTWQLHSKILYSVFSMYLKYLCTYQLQAPLLPPGAYGARGGDLSNQNCTIPHIWGIPVLANPLQYPMFPYPPPSLFCLETFAGLKCVIARCNFEEQCPTMPDLWGTKAQTNPLPSPSIYPRWGLQLIDALHHRRECSRSRVRWHFIEQDGGESWRRSITIYLWVKHSLAWPDRYFYRAVIAFSISAR